MRYFNVQFHFKTRPMFHKGRWKTEWRAFGAHTQEEALRLARDDGENRYSRRQWKIGEVKELTVTG